MGTYFGQGTGGIWARLTETVSASSTENVDTIDLSNFFSIDYVLTIYNETEGKIATGNLKVLNINSTEIKDQVYAKINSGLSIEVNPKLVLSEMRLEIVNNETFDLTVEVAKLVI